MRTTVPALLTLLILLPTVGLSACSAEAGPDSGSDPGTASESATAPALVVEDPWVRATTDTEDPSMTAAFLLLDNESEDEVTLTGVSSPVARHVELHEMASVDGSAEMREIRGGIVLAPGRGQLLQPGGTHVMLMGLTEELAAGDEVELTLELADGGRLAVTAPVKQFTEEEGHYHEPGTGEHSH